MKEPMGNNISEAFLITVTELLGETNNGYTWSEIARLSNAYAVDFDTDIPYPSTEFPTELKNKRTGLLQNIKAFSPRHQFQILDELLDSPKFQASTEALKLRQKLHSRYSDVSEVKDHTDEVLVKLIQQANKYAKSKSLLEEARAKRKAGIYSRNSLDDLRLALELLLKDVLSNNKPLEKQQADLGTFIKNKNGSKHLGNTFLILVDHFSKYQNDNVKHDIKEINKEELDFIFDQAISFMNLLLQLENKS